ncbi:sensor histidine kinase [Massilia sp. Root335]|uniref:sensor histidine kinase n=1 Tax=Massilia sp. Root335 TaxID=1736517 RepID=UPI0006F78E9A|nr:histidine kinase [Massilia sp. Root335]KQV36095.1 autolysin [Massilia sp. Root335]
MQTRRSTQQAFSNTLSVLYRVFDAVATWVTQLSWWKFFLFAALMLVSGKILQDELFSGSDEEIALTNHKQRAPEPTVTIDDSGIHINPGKNSRRGTITINPEVEAAKAEAAAKAAAAARAAAAGKSEDAQARADEAAAAAEKAADAADRAADSVAPAEPAVPASPAPPAPPAPAAGKAGHPVAKTVRGANGEEVHIDLPPQIGEELSNAIEAAVDDAAEAKARSYHKQASTWFTSFVWLLILALFGTKALVGGKKRAEAEMQSATAAAERESMQRQLSEAKMQAMQAQVEPHFLFNTLASVEHLIETNPPRASAMQRTLIQYLRAVLPQMRDNNLVTNLGREVDMVKSYLDLLKMRMEERLTVELHVPEGLRSAAFPPMMLQSMVENAIKHGLECKPEGGHLAVSAEVVDSRLRVTVADDGVGFGVVPSKGTGLGLSNIRERLKLLHGDGGQLHIAANSPSGVIATIEVPYQLAPK